MSDDPRRDVKMFLWGALVAVLLYSLILMASVTFVLWRLGVWS